MKIAIPKELAAGQTLVAATATTVKTYVKSGMSVTVQAGAGEGAFISDEQSRQAGAAVEADEAAVLAGADIILKVHPPGKDAAGRDEISLMPAGCVLVAMLDPTKRGRLLSALASANISAFAMELVPRITRAQSLDALSSLSTAAGYKAALLAADHLPKMLPMLMTAAGTVQPCTVMVIGAGVAGLQAIATAKRLGANVKAVDTRPVVREQVESLGARFIHLEVAPHRAQTAGGYAKDLGEEFYRHEQETIAPHLKGCDAVISTALIPGRAAPILITEPMVRSMPAGSVIIDLAVNNGGNCSLTKADKSVSVGGVTILGPTNLPATMSVHASQMYANNLAAFVQELVKDDQVKVDMNNEILRAMLVTHEGKVLYPPPPAVAVPQPPPREG